MSLRRKSEAGRSGLLEEDLMMSEGKKKDSGEEEVRFRRGALDSRGGMESVLRTAKS